MKGEVCVCSGIVCRSVIQKRGWCSCRDDGGTGKGSRMPEHFEAFDLFITCAEASSPTHVQLSSDESPKCRFGPTCFAAHGKRRVVLTPSPGRSKFFLRPDGPRRRTCIHRKAGNRLVALSPEDHAILRGVYRES